MITGLHLLQRYPQIVDVKSREDMYVRNGKLFIGCNMRNVKPARRPKTKYFKLGHDVAHFIEAPKNRLFTYNVGLPSLDNWQYNPTRDVRKKLRAAALRELRTEIIHYRMNVAFINRADTLDEWIKIRTKMLYKRMNPGFHGMTKTQALRYLRQKAQQYRKKYTKRFVHAELERRLQLIAA